MGGQLLVEAFVLWPIHDHKDRRRKMTALTVPTPMLALQQARSFAGGVEEDGLATHGGPHQRVSAIRSLPPATRIYALCYFAFQRQNAASLAARAPIEA